MILVYRYRARVTSNEGLRLSLANMYVFAQRKRFSHGLLCGGYLFFKVSLYIHLRLAEILIFTIRGEARLQQVGCWKTKVCIFSKGLILRYPQHSPRARNQIIMSVARRLLT